MEFNIVVWFPILTIPFSAQNGNKRVISQCNTFHCAVSIDRANPMHCEIPPVSFSHGQGGIKDEFI